jgi:hypothetical protein
MKAAKNAIPHAVRDADGKVANSRGGPRRGFETVVIKDR